MTPFNRAMSARLRWVEGRSPRAKLVALLVEPAHGQRETSLPLGCQPEVCDPEVALGALPLHEPGPLRPPDELRDGALGELEPLRELGHGRLLAPVGRALDHQEQDVPAGCEAGGTGELLARAQEGADLRAERGDADRVVGVEPGLRAHAWEPAWVVGPSL